MLIHPGRRTAAVAVASFLCILYIFFAHSSSHPATAAVAPPSPKDQDQQPPSAPASQQQQQKQQQQSAADAIPVIYPEPFAHHAPSAGEKLLAYLPHSGFHNQRIELENALLLASYLNRTLLLPPVFLGNPAMPWLRFDKMYERLLLQTKRGLEHCPQIGADEPLPAECLNYFRWTKVPWTFFYNLEHEIERHVRIVFRDDLSEEWLRDTFGLQSKDIHYMKDVSPYEFRVYDRPDSPTPLAKFVNRIDIAALEAIDARVLHFGSVFGTYRVLAQTEEHAQLLKTIRSNMIFSHPVLRDTAARVVQQLGGIDQFVGLHIRVGDGLFKVRASIHVDDIFHQLVDRFTDLSVDQVARYEDYRHDDDRKENDEYEVRQLRKFTQIDQQQLAKPIAVDHPSSDMSHVLGTSPPPALQRTCQTPQDDTTARFQRTVIYIATDAPLPRTNPLLRKIFATFPCVFVLDDFDELHDLKRIQVVEERIKLQSYLIPMVDAMIAAQGHTFIGTADSTFSTYIERQLHPVYTNRQVKVMGIGSKKQAPAAAAAAQS